MSSPELKRALAEIEKKSMEKAYPKKPKKTDVLPRNEYEKIKGQILIINELEYLNSIQPLYSKSRSLMPEAKPLFRKIDAYFAKGEARLQMSKDILAQTKANAAKLKTKPDDHVYIVSSFGSAKTKKFKEKNEIDVSHIAAEHLNKVMRANVSAREISSKHDIGHGDVGMSSAEYTLARETRRAAKKFDLTKTEEKMLNDIIIMERTKLKLKVNFEHDQVMDSKGNLKKDWSVMLNFQEQQQNSREGILEKELKGNVLSRFDKIALNPNSTPLIEALSKVLMWNFKPRKGMKVTGSRVSRIKESSKAGYNRTHEYGENAVYGAQRGLKIRKGAFKQPKVEKRKARSIPSLLNKDLGETVQGNMRSPGLENRTGNFAQSVRVLKEIVGSGKTLPIIQYTYDADPYQVFETGAKGDRRWATKARDPRLLIEKSIREVARQFALGKFKVQRM